MLQWAIFSVLVALVPILFDIAMQLLETEMNWPSDYIKAGVRAVGRGELLLISTAIAAEAIGNLIGTNKESEFVKLLAGGACVLTILFGSFWYATIAASSHVVPLQAEQKVIRICLGSVGIFLFTLISSGSAKLVAEG